MSPARFDNVAAIIGDRLALQGLRTAVDMALASGAGGTFVFSSDGEGYSLAVALESNMNFVQTSYACEPCPVRSLREVVPLRAVKNFSTALNIAMQQAMEATAPPARVASAEKYGQSTPIIAAPNLR
jgi:hypothetical protein